MANPWRLLAPDVQQALRVALLDPEVYSWYAGNNAKNVRKEVPGARPFGGWYDEYYRKPLGSAVNEKSVFAEWRFNHALTLPERNSLLCVYAKLRAEQLWEQVDTVYWVGATGEILFVPTQPPDALKQFLCKRGYGDWWLASHNCKWGVRSRFRGVQLHFRGPHDKPRMVNAHIDLNNPGDSTTPGAKPTGAFAELGQALRHSWRDDTNRATTHTALQLRAALAGSGVAVPSVP
jgi:hypothetical protein